MTDLVLGPLLVGTALFVGAPAARNPTGGGTVLPEMTGRPPRAVTPGPGRPAPSGDAAPHVHRRSEALPRPQAIRGGGLRYAFPSWVADVASDGTVVFRDRRVRLRPRQTELTFEWADGGSRRRGGDPHALAKLRFLEDTRDLRAALRAQARARWQRAYVTDLPLRLARLWARRDLAPAAKRLLIYQLWRECLEPSAPGWQVAAGRARTEILAFVRRVLPVGSPNGYTRDELAWMGRPEKGRETFAP